MLPNLKHKKHNIYPQLIQFFLRIVYLWKVYIRRVLIHRKVSVKRFVLDISKTHSTIPSLKINPSKTKTYNQFQPFFLYFLNAQLCVCWEIYLHQMNSIKVLSSFLNLFVYTKVGWVILLCFFFCAVFCLFLLYILPLPKFQNPNVGC